MEHVPTITGDIATIKIGNLHFHLWDFAGQEQFSYLWNNFVKGSDAVLLITDSYLENVEKSKYFLDLIKDEAPDAHTAIIGNKQDLGDRLPVVEIEKILGLKTYSMIANRSENRDKMITIIADILEMSAEVSPLLKPLIERDRSMVEAESALNSGDLQNALTLFEKIADLSIDLGDDSLGKEFHEKAEKIREIVKKMETTQVEIVKTPEVAEEEATEPVTPPAPPPASPTEPPKPPEAGPVAPPAPPPAVPTKPPKPPAPPPAVPTKPPKPPVAVPVAPPASPVGIPAEPDRPTSSPPTLEPPEDTPKITINLADFKIKKRPTNILAAKPTGPKATLKTTPFGHVKPQSLPISPPPTSAAPTPTPAPKPVPKSPPSELISPVVAEAPTGDKILTQKSEIEKSLMDLKIKLASISKMELDLEMKEISGDITSEEFEEKKNKMAKLKGNISKQIQELENLLSNF
jgi:GTPase SAR1 family protein